MCMSAIEDVSICVCKCACFVFVCVYTYAICACLEFGEQQFPVGSAFFIHDSRVYYRLLSSVSLLSVNIRVITVIYNATRRRAPLQFGQVLPEAWQSNVILEANVNGRRLQRVCDALIMNEDDVHYTLKSTAKKLVL